MARFEHQGRCLDLFGQYLLQCGVNLWSLLATMCHAGFVCQAAVVTLSPTAVEFHGPANMTFASAFDTSGAKYSNIPFPVSDKYPEASCFAPLKPGRVGTAWYVMDNEFHTATWADKAFDAVT